MQETALGRDSSHDLLDSVPGVVLEKALSLIATVYPTLGQECQALPWDGVRDRLGRSGSRVPGTQWAFSRCHQSEHCEVLLVALSGVKL